MLELEDDREVDRDRERELKDDRQPEKIVHPLPLRILPDGDRPVLFSRIMAMVQGNLNNRPSPLKDVMYFPPKLNVNIDSEFEILVAPNDQPMEHNVDAGVNNTENVENPCLLCFIRNSDCAINSCNHRFCRVCIERISPFPQFPLCQRRSQELLYLLETEINTKNFQMNSTLMKLQEIQMRSSII